MSSTGRAAPDQARRTSRLAAANFAACLLLLAQYLLGMVVNIYVVLPARHPGAAAGNYFSGVASGVGWLIPDGPGWAAAHAAFGLALVVAAFAAITFARGQHSRVYLVLAVLAALAITGAAFNGASFLNYGRPFSSMLMAALWAVALACYVVSLFRAARSHLRLM
jgi:hypothetical protein